MNLPTLLLTFISSLPKEIAIPILGAALIFYIFGEIFVHKKNIKRSCLAILTVIVLILTTISVFAVYFYLNNPRSITNISNQDAKAVQTSNNEIVNPICFGWQICSDFRNDTNLVNNYYTHTTGDPQTLFLESSPFLSPPLYLNVETSPYFTFKIDVQPLGQENANIFVEGKQMFRLFIGDNDYRSLAFLTWDMENSDWVRDNNSKIYLGKDLNLPDIQPKTQLTIEAVSARKGNKASLDFTISYKSVGQNTKTAHIVKVVDIPAADPTKFSTMVGVGMFRSKGNIPQAKFTFFGLR